MLRTNIASERRNADGTVDYVVDLGAVVWNDRIVDIGKLIIPIRSQVLFSLPDEAGKYAIVNAYYGVEKGIFVFDRVSVHDSFVGSSSSRAIPNLLPLAQFVVKESLGSNVVMRVNEYSRMSTFSISDGGETGDQGLQGPLGETGWVGMSGSQGITGAEGTGGLTGQSGATGVGAPGAQGVQGCTGVYPDTKLRLYLKFKTVDDIQTDYSMYQQDCEWLVTGMGVTGSESLSFFTKESGIVDSCHSVTYNGDMSFYYCGDYVDFSGYTGVIQAWVRVDIQPESDFTYTGVAGLTGALRFTEHCGYFPESWLWYMDGAEVSTSKIFTRKVLTGEHLVKLRCSNAAGYMDKTKLITMP